MKEKIPFNRVDIMGEEIENINIAINNGDISGDGAFTAKCHILLQDSLNVPKVLLTTSCTHALEMSALLLDIQPNDEVILPSFTFVSTANAFVLRGAKPVFVDIKEDTLNIDENLIENKVTEKTKAIVPVHYAGVGCEMDRIMEIANRYSVGVIEDNAHGLYGKYKGQYLGTFGQFATQSFHETKNFSCGEGGALIINDESHIDRAEIIREKGTDRSNYFRGQVDKYSWVDIGSSYLPSDILSAFLYAQLCNKILIQKKRRIIWENYNARLKDWARSNGVILPYVPDYCEQTYHMYYIILPTYGIRDDFINYLLKEKIRSVFHYIPLHESKMGVRYGYRKDDFPVTEDISRRLVRLPLYNNLDPNVQERIIHVINNYQLK